MKFAFCLYKHFPYSGLSRDMLRILNECTNRGHEVVVFTGSWEGPKPDNADVVIIPHMGLSNHTRAAAFHRKLFLQLGRHTFDMLVGFNKIPYMDIYFCGDYCFVGRAMQKYSWLYHKTPRFLFFRNFENSVFSTISKTKILSLSEREKSIYQEYYLTQDRRFYDIPPTLDRYRREIWKKLPNRQFIRERLGVSEDQYLLLLVGSGFKTKGLDRALKAIASLPENLSEKTTFFVVGQDKEDGFRALAEKLGIASHVEFLGGRDDVPELMKAADLLVHPAYAETTGTVILEAITYGLPVLATKVCGYAHHIGKAKAGNVLRSPFRQEEFDEKLAAMLVSDEREQWHKNGLLYGDNDDLYKMPQCVAEIIEQEANEHSLNKNNNLANHVSGDFYLRQYFADSLKKNVQFSDLMAMDGEVYREAPGRRTVKFERGGKSYFIKTHTGVGWQEILKNLLYLRAPVVGALNEWHGVHRLTDLEIDTMTVAGYGIRGKNPAKRRSFIVTEALPTSVSLEDYTQSWKTHPPKSMEQIIFKRRVIKKIAEITRTMHENGANHRDYYLCHFLLDLPEGNYDKMRLFLIDLHRMQLRRKTPVRWKVKDVAGLYFSSLDIGLTKRDMYRFMVAYRGKPLKETLAERKFWKAVLKRGKSLHRSEQSNKAKLARNVVRT
ncbi:MAG: lipopolysaccharide core heptose(I) kinase RfaP [Arenicella sp.]